MSFEGMQEWLAVLDPGLKAKQGKTKHAQLIREAAEQAKEAKESKDHPLSLAPDAKPQSVVVGTAKTAEDKPKVQESKREEKRAASVHGAAEPPKGSVGLANGRSVATDEKQAKAAASPNRPAPPLVAQLSPPPVRPADAKREAEEAKQGDTRSAKSSTTQPASGNAEKKASVLAQTSASGSVEQKEKSEQAKAQTQTQAATASGVLSAHPPTGNIVQAKEEKQTAASSSAAPVKDSAASVKESEKPQTQSGSEQKSASGKRASKAKKKKNKAKAEPISMTSAQADKVARKRAELVKEYPESKMKRNRWPLSQALQGVNASWPQGLSWDSAITLLARRMVERDAVLTACKPTYAVASS